MSPYHDRQPRVERIWRMKTMKMPGFSAEASLCKTRTNFTIGATKSVMNGEGILPQVRTVSGGTCNPTCLCVTDVGCPCCGSLGYGDDSGGGGGGGGGWAVGGGGGGGGPVGGGPGDEELAPLPSQTYAECKERCEEWHDELVARCL